MPEKSTKRRASKTAINSTHGARNTRQFNAEQSWRGLEARIERLELLIGMLPDTHESENHPYIRVGGKHLKTRGPKTIPDFELSDRRDELITFFESNWPELEPLCTPSPDLEALRQAFQAFANPGRSKTPWGTQVAFVAPGIVGNHSAAVTRLLLPKTFSQFERFLRGQQKRFAANPRQLANAIAGCPDLTFWTSLKRCQQLPFRFGIDQRAMRAYIRRLHPRLYKKLSERPGLPELAAFCHKYRTQDVYVAQLRAEALERFWTVGTPITKR
jgi:hypothetical protein